MENGNVQQVASEIIVALHSLSSVVKLYDINNAAVIRQIDTLHDTLQKGFAQGITMLRLTLRSDEFFANGDLMKVDVQLYIRAREVATFLERFNWNDVSFENTCTKDDIRLFVADFAKCVRKEIPTFSSAQFGGITGKKSAGSASAAFRFDPNKMAIWLVAGLLEVVDKLYVLFEKGERPSLLPIRRSLQMMIDNMKSYSGIYQMLSAFRDPNRPRTRAQIRVAMAIDVIGVCSYLQRSNVEMLEMAMAAILSGLSDKTEALDVIEPILDFDGIGESALGMVLLIHDSISALEGKSAAIDGLILATVMKYHLELDRNPSLPLPTVMFQLVQDSSSQLRSMSQVFARYKGPFPIGSFIQVDNEVVLVVGQSLRKTGKQRPMVARLQGKQILEVLDLSTSPQKVIQAVESLQNYEHCLEDLVLG